jgi:hypothetical protein
VTFTAMVVRRRPDAGTDRRQGGRALAGREPVQPDRAQRRRRKMIAWLFKKQLLAAVEGVAFKAITKSGQTKQSSRQSHVIRTQISRTEALRSAITCLINRACGRFRHHPWSSSSDCRRRCSKPFLISRSTKIVSTAIRFLWSGLRV